MREEKMWHILVYLQCSTLASKNMKWSVTAFHSHLSRCCCSMLSAFSNWEPGLSAVSTANILMLHQPTRLKQSLRMKRRRKPNISSLLVGAGEGAHFAVLLWRRIMTICFCGSYMRQESGRISPVLFLFTYVFLRAMWIKMCNDEKGFREFCIKLSYCSFLSWMML